MLCGVGVGSRNLGRDCLPRPPPSCGGKDMWLVFWSFCASCIDFMGLTWFLMSATAASVSLGFVVKVHPDGISLG